MQQRRTAAALLRHDTGRRTPAGAGDGLSRGHSAQPFRPKGRAGCGAGRARSPVRDGSRIHRDGMPLPPPICGLRGQPAPRLLTSAAAPADAVAAENATAGSLSAENAVAGSRPPERFRSGCRSRDAASAGTRSAVRVRLPRAGVRHGRNPGAQDGAGQTSTVPQMQARTITWPMTCRNTGGPGAGLWFRTRPPPEG